VAALIKRDTGADATLVVGGRGEFAVLVGDEQVAGKSSRGFPGDDEIVDVVRQALRKSS
jgi:hypothetical protein